MNLALIISFSKEKYSQVYFFTFVTLPKREKLLNRGEKTFKAFFQQY